MSKNKFMTLTDARLKFGKLGLLAKPAPIEVAHGGKVEFVVVSPEWFASHAGPGAEAGAGAGQASPRRVVRPLAKNPLGS